MIINPALLDKNDNTSALYVVNEDVDNEGTNDQYEDYAADDENYAKGDPL